MPTVVLWLRRTCLCARYICPVPGKYGENWSQYVTLTFRPAQLLQAVTYWTHGRRFPGIQQTGSHVFGIRSRVSRAVVMRDEFHKRMSDNGGSDYVLFWEKEGLSLRWLWGGSRGRNTGGEQVLHTQAPQREAHSPFQESRQIRTIW